MLGQYSTQLISFPATAILARLLSPDEIGVFAVASSIAYLAVEIRSFGVGEYLIREKEVDDNKLRSVLGVMMIMSWGLALILMGGAHWLAQFYDEPDLRYILWIIAIPFFLAPHSSVPFAILAREMKFDTILKINLIGCLARHVSSIGLVLLDYGYWALAWGTLIGVVAEFLMITYYRPGAMPWLPAFANVRHVFQVGFQISFAKVLYSTSQNASDLVLGRMASMADVGLFSRGLGLIQFIHSLLVKAVGPVALPHLAQVKRSGGNVADAYVNAVVLVGAFALPVFAVVNLSAHTMITALFGDQWGPSVKIASILSIWAILQAVHCFSAPALLSVGKERLFMVKEVLTFASKFAFIILTVPSGLEAVAWGFVAAAAFELLLCNVLLKMALGLTAYRLFVAFIPNVLVAAACWLTLKLMGMFIAFESMNSWLALLIIASAMTPVWLISLKLTANPAWPHLQDTLGRLMNFARSQRSEG